MPRSNPHSASNHRRTQSAANPRVWRGQEEAAKPDRRPSDDRRGRGEQAPAPCAHCGAVVNMRKVSANVPSRFGDLPTGTAVTGQHREGGGVYNARRGDVLCPGAGALPDGVQSDE